jgi:predicted Zn-dependent protease
VIGVLKNQELFDAETAKQEGREPQRYHGLFASHPDNDTRLKEVVGAAEKLRSRAGDEDREIFLARTGGLVFGESAREGVLREGSFYHAELGFALKLPADWRARNLPDRLVCLAPGGEAQLQMRTQKRPDEEPADFLRRLTRGAATDIDLSDVNGLSAAMSTMRRQFVAAVFMNDNAYVFSGAAKSDEAFERFVEPMRESVRSLHLITEAEKARAKPLVLKTITASETTRFAGLARGSQLRRNAESVLRLINGMYPAGEPKPGQTVKVIE